MSEQDQSVGHANGTAVLLGKPKRRSERRRLTRKRHADRKKAALVAQSRVEHFGRKVRGTDDDSYVTAVYRDLKARARRLKHRARC
ncbi:MAG: hypothetical protein PHS73_01110 [Candidatus Peribacteraceae bacterium]|nr:hypothetical protein [Candidatus Peribacteraceae bacterium]